MGDRIQEQRKRRGLSQEKLAELVGVSRQAVTKWEAGQSVPTCENLMALPDLFQLPLDTLVSGAPPGGEAERGRRRPNPILRANLTMLAISFQAGRSMPAPRSPIPGRMGCGCRTGRCRCSKSRCCF